MASSIKYGILLLLFFGLYNSGCSAGTRGSNLPYNTPAVATGRQLSDPSGLSVQTRSLIHPQSKFVAYSRSAERLTIIDLDSLTEDSHFVIAPRAWKAIPFAGLDGIALIGEKEALVLSDGNIEHFDIPSQLNSFAIAENVAAIAGINSETNSIRMIRTLGGGVWEDHSIDNPFKKDQSSLMLSGDGTQLITINDTNGSYAFASAESVSSKMGNFATCSLPASSQQEIAAAILIDSLKKMLIFAFNGTYVTVDFSSATACHDYSMATWMGSSTVRPTRASMISRDIIGVSHNNGSVSFLTHGKTGIFSESNVDVDCDFGLGINPVGLKNAALICLIDGKIQSDSSIGFSDAEIVTFSRSNGALIAKSTINLSVTEQAVFNPTSNQIAILRTGGFGTIDSIDLESGAITEKDRIFIPHYLESL